MTGTIGSPRQRSRGYLLDVYIEGEHVHRRASVEVVGDNLSVDGQAIPFRTIFWVSRRAGLLLLFGEDFTMAFKGRGQDLEELARALEFRADWSQRRRQLLEPFAGEIVVCTAGTAVTGSVEDEKVQGLYLAVFTRRALHLLSKESRLTVAWPVDRAQCERTTAGRMDQETLVLRKTGTWLRLRYLFPEEIRAARRAAEQKTREVDPERDGDALEMFARGQVARPVPPRLPEFKLAVEQVRAESATAAGRIPDGLLEGAAINRSFVDAHFKELGEVALGPLLARRSAAGAAESLQRALEVLNTSELRADTDAAAEAAAEYVASAFEAEARRVLGGRRRRGRPRAVPSLSDEERRTLAGRLREPVNEMVLLFSRLESCQETLLRGLEAYEEGPPEGVPGPFETAAEEWRTALARVDGAFGTVWKRLLDVVSGAWTETLIPRLVAARTAHRPRWPEPLRVILLVGGTLLAIVLLVLLF